MKDGRGVRRLTMLAPLLCLCVLIPLAAPDLVRAQDQEKEPEVILPACGIRYPGGYDPNTVGVIEGRVASFSRPEMGPVSFRLEDAGERYTVLAAPSWFWEERKLTLKDGDWVRVKGSKTMGADGNLYLVAQEITFAGADQPVAFRDARGRPLWSGCGPRGCGRHR